MKTITQSPTKTQKASKSTPFTSNPRRTIEWLGGVNYDNLDRTLDKLKNLLADDSHEEVQLLVNSYGGVTAIGMSFFDTVKTVLKPKLTTIGTGDVDSSGVIVFLSGEKRYMTRNATMLLHLGGRTFQADKRFTSLEVENMVKEDRLRNYQYACVLADATEGRATPEKILDLMAADTILTAEESVNLGLAHKVLA